MGLLAADRKRLTIDDREGILDQKISSWTWIEGKFVVSHSLHV